MRGNVFAALLTLEKVSTPAIPTNETDCPISRVHSARSSQINLSSNTYNRPSSGQGDKRKHKDTSFKVPDKDGVELRKVESTDRDTTTQNSSLIDILPNLNKPDYEDPLVQCGCCDIYWTPYFARIIKERFNVDLKCRSKKGTPFYGIKTPATRSNLSKWLKNSAVTARRQGMHVKEAVSRRWVELGPWRNQLQNPDYIEKVKMEQEIDRLRRALEESYDAERSRSLPSQYGGLDTSFQSSSPHIQPLISKRLDPIQNPHNLFKLDPSSSDNLHGRTHKVSFG